MTLSRIGPGDLWELHTREGTLVATGSLYQMICLWARLVRHGWCDLPWGTCRGE